MSNNKPGPASTDFSSTNVDIKYTHPVICDIAYNLYLRALVEGGYRTIIEIGAYSGERILHLKRTMPSVEAYGLDIVKTYHNEHSVEGVNIRLFSLDFFKIKRDKAIVLSRGTMANMSENFLSEFLQVLHMNDYDIAMCEQAPFREIQQTSPRSSNSFYHPYPKLLRQAGYHFDQNYEAATWHTGILSEMEAWYCMTAKV